MSEEEIRKSCLSSGHRQGGGRLGEVCVPCMEYDNRILRTTNASLVAEVKELKEAAEAAYAQGVENTEARASKRIAELEQNYRILKSVDGIDPSATQYADAVLKAVDRAEAAEAMLFDIRRDYEAEKSRAEKAEARERTLIEQADLHAGNYEASLAAALKERDEAILRADHEHANSMNEALIGNEARVADSAALTKYASLLSAAKQAQFAGESALSAERERGRVMREALKLAEHELTTLHNLDASDDPERLLRNPFTIDTGKARTAIKAALSQEKPKECGPKSAHLFCDGHPSAEAVKPKEDSK